MRFGTLGVYLLSFTTLAFVPSATSQDLRRPDVELTQDGSDELGPEDELIVSVVQTPEIHNKAVRVDPQGYIDLPFAGRIRATGLSVAQVRERIAVRMAEYIMNPEVSVGIGELRSQRLSVVGAVRKPGMYRVRAGRRVLDMISEAGGLDDHAGYIVKITRSAARGSIPIPNATLDGSRQWVSAEIDMTSLLRARDPVENIPVAPDDVITVPAAELVYVMGEVRKPGGFAVREQTGISVLKAVSLAEGALRTASLKKARILRAQAAGRTKIEIPVNLAEVLAGRSPDVMLRSEDILFVPNSASKAAALRSIEAAVQIGTGLVIWRR